MVIYFVGLRRHGVQDGEGGHAQARRVGRRSRARSATPTPSPTWGSRSSSRSTGSCPRPPVEVTQGRQAGSGCIKSEKRQHVGQLRARRPFEPSTEVGIRSDLQEDLYIVFAGSVDGTEEAVYRFTINPLVWWVWIGGVVLVVGGLVTMWPGGGTVLRGPPPRPGRLRGRAGGQWREGRSAPSGPRDSPAAVPGDGRRSAGGGGRGVRRAPGPRRRAARGAGCDRHPAGPERGRPAAGRHPPADNERVRQADRAPAAVHLRLHPRRLHLPHHRLHLHLFARAAPGGPGALAGRQERAADRRRVRGQVRREGADGSEAGGIQPWGYLLPGVAITLGAAILAVVIGRRERVRSVALAAAPGSEGGGGAPPVAATPEEARAAARGAGRGGRLDGDPGGACRGVGSCRPVDRPPAVGAAGRARAPSGRAARSGGDASGRGPHRAQGDRVRPCHGQALRRRLRGAQGPVHDGCPRGAQGRIGGGIGRRRGDDRRSRTQPSLRSHLDAIRRSRVPGLRPPAGAGRRVLLLLRLPARAPRPVRAVRGRAAARQPLLRVLAVQHPEAASRVCSRASRSSGFARPTPIQAEAIPAGARRAGTSSPAP